MNMEEKEFDVVTLEDGQEYFILDEIEIDGTRYLYLSTDADENQKFRIRKIKMAGSIEMLVGLDSDDEFDKALVEFNKNHINDEF